MDLKSIRLFFYAAVLCIAPTACDHNREWELGYLPPADKQGVSDLSPVDGGEVARPEGWVEWPVDSLPPVTSPADTLQAGPVSTDASGDPSTASGGHPKGSGAHPDASGDQPNPSSPRPNRPASESDPHFFNPHVSSWEEETLEILLN